MPHVGQGTVYAGVMADALAPMTGETEVWTRPAEEMGDGIRYEGVEVTLAVGPDDEIVRTTIGTLRRLLIEAGYVPLA